MALKMRAVDGIAEVIYKWRPFQLRTGATATGKQLMKTAADTIKGVHLELGGEAPC